MELTWPRHGTQVLDDRFPAMGTIARVVRDAAGDPDAVAVFAELERPLSRFDPRSELSRLTADPRASVPASALLRAAVGAALRSAELTGGLVDPTLLGPLRGSGYDRSRARTPPASILDALASAPPRRPA